MPPKILDSEPEFTLGPVPADSCDSTGGRPSKPELTNSRWVAGLCAAGLFVGCAVWYFVWSGSDPQPQHVETASPPASAIPTPPSKPAVQYPVENIHGSSKPLPYFRTFPLPSLDDSDFVARDAIDAILDNSAFVRLLVPDAVIRHIVATVDSLPRKVLAERIRPIEPVTGLFVVESDAQGTAISRANSDRYATYVRAAESIDNERLVEFYVRLYPLFQQAYVELGHPGGYFNDRLIGVIDDLLDAPELSAPVHVYQAKVLYEFIDPELEGISAGQKILIRVGIENELRLKAKLRSIRAMLTTGSAGEALAPGSNRTNPQAPGKV
jgi:hypothetical protein